MSIKSEIMEDCEGLNFEETIEYLENVCNYGCNTGVVGSMIYYSDTLEFFHRNRVEIFELLKRDDIKPHQLNGWDENDPCGYEGHNRNLLAWAGYEMVARDLLYTLEEER